MAKDYFQDILSQSGNSPRQGASAAQGKNPPGISFEDGDTQNVNAAPADGERTIRNISVSPRRAARTSANDMRDISAGVVPPMSGQRGPVAPSRRWIWIVAILSVIVLAALGLFAFRNTTVTVIPASHTVVFDQKSRFSAYPASSVTPGQLSYTVVASDIDDSAVVPSKGTEHVSERASGTITVYNEYSSAPVKIIKNTRFATPEGLVFRVPASIVVPGKKGSTPGSTSVTVFADQPGAEYNVGPITRFTLPGLKSSTDMYAKVYARSSAAMSGGFVGDRPAVAPGALESARAEIRGRLESKARDNARALSTASVTSFLDLMQITYSSLPETAEAGGGVRIHEKAHVEIPVFPADAFASAVLSMVDATAAKASVTLVGADVLVAHSLSSGVNTALGSSPINFTVSGTAKLVWTVDSVALSAALAGRDQTAFQTIISGFPSIQEARARIEPFWKSTFPATSSDIRVEVALAQAAQ